MPGELETQRLRRGSGFTSCGGCSFEEFAPHHSLAEKARKVGNWALVPEIHHIHQQLRSRKSSSCP